MVVNLNIQFCPSTLQEGYTKFSPLALRHLFNKKEVSQILTFNRDKKNASSLIEKRKKISISGVQEKYSVKLVGKELQLTDKGGEYILKPIPRDLLNVDQVPANEHVTMQIAEQVFDIETAKNTIIFFSDGEMAYLTKRFDVLPNGERSLKEDFATLSNRTIETNGTNFKYDSSYLEMADLIDKYIPTALFTKEKLFALAIFNYLMGNGDAHLKNFSVIDYLQNGLFQLAPAYDLLCTGLHIDDSDIALTDRLYDGDIDHPSFAKYGCYCYDDFFTLGEKMGIRTQRVAYFLNHFTTKTEKVQELVNRSFLSDDMKTKYMQLYKGKLIRFNTSYQKEYG